MERMSKQLILSGKLKPEVRLGIEISNFAQSLDDERREEFRRMQTAKGIHLSGWDVIKVTEEINQEGSRRHRSWKTHGTKVGGFLSRIQTLISIGDVLIGGSQDLIATGVWSAVRLSLTIATNYMGYFEKLSTLFMRLGTSWALHEDFAQLFPRSEILQTYFCEYLVTLMKLCNKVVVFGQKNTGAQLFSSLGSFFDSEFGTIQKELDQWGCLIQQQCQILAMKIATGAENSRSHEVKQRILRRLSPYQNDLETRWRRQRKKGTCKWIFDNPTFKDWKSMQKSTTLCISGKLGSGKTVSMANIVARTDLEQPCAYAFCASQEPTSLKATDVLGSIAFSLLDHLPPEAMVWGDAEQSDAMINTFDPESIINFVLGLLPLDRTYIIIVDGLEDCSDADITDVMSGLRRLAQSRVVLLCYSSRSDSRFQLVAKQNLTPEFLISHDDSHHDAELESYIVKEVTRRNTTRHLSPDLEGLVTKQLILGAQGMYLWASLQLDSIFPANSKVVITDDHILNLITHLPKDLPEAFERALEGIPDHQYEGKIMKLVMSAATPLNLDEIRVALCVVPGEPVWHPEKIAKNGTQLISLCGGNLLDLDEEDGKVRFIHHSVIQHLLSPATNQNTTPYHFTAEDAEHFIGATCVTYLHLPVFDTRVMATWNHQSLHVGILDNVMKTTKQSAPAFSRLVQHIRWREHKRARPSQFDIGHILSQIQAARVQEDLDPRCFAHYATSHWVIHTRFFDENIEKGRETCDLWWRLMCGDVATVMSPCAELKDEPSNALVWAVEHAHGFLFRYALRKSGPPEHEIGGIMRALETHKSIQGQWLGDFFSRYLLSLSSLEMPLTADRITLFFDLGADPIAPGSEMDWIRRIRPISPIEILTDRICTGALSDEDEQKLVRQVFSHPAVHKSLADWAVFSILEKLRQSSKSLAIAEILMHHPHMRCNFQQFQFQEQTPGGLAIEIALDNDRWEEVNLLASQNNVNRPTTSNVTLLWKAIEMKSDKWVYRLLHLGADPNLGPFEMRQHMSNQSFEPVCFPLEAALWLGRTRVCLELLFHGANVGWLGDSPMRIAEETGNSIMIARLGEIRGWCKRRDQTGHQQRYEGGHTALTTACKMLSHTSSSEPPGFPKLLKSYYDIDDWKSELHQIISRLALDKDPEYLNARDEDGKTALHHLSGADDTASPSFTNLVITLLNQGADPHLQDQRLLKAGANPNTSRRLRNVSVLEEAMIEYKGTQKDVMRLVRLLLQAGADPRNLVTLASPDPSLTSIASERGLQSLTTDFEEFRTKWKDKVQQII